MNECEIWQWRRKYDGSDINGAGLLICAFEICMRNILSGIQTLSALIAHSRGMLIIWPSAIHGGDDVSTGSAVRVMIILSTTWGRWSRRRSGMIIYEVRSPQSRFLRAEVLIFHEWNSLLLEWSLSADSAYEIIFQFRTPAFIKTFRYSYFHHRLQLTTYTRSFSDLKHLLWKNKRQKSV